MAETLDQYLAPSEKVLYRTPREWLPPGLLRELLVCVAFVAAALAFGYYSLDREGLSRVFNFTMIATFLAYGYVGRSHANQVAVTDGRLMRLDGNSNPSELQTIALEEIEAVEVFPHEVRVTKRDGTAVGLPHSDYSGEIGQALASAAGLPAPVVPKWQEFAAYYVANLAGLIGWFYLANLGWHVLSAADMVPISFMQWLPVLAAGLLAIIPGWLAGEAMCAVALKRFFDPETFTRWRRGYLRTPDARATPGPFDWLQRWRRHLFDFAVGPLPPDETKGGGHG